MPQHCNSSSKIHQQSDVVVHWEYDHNRLTPGFYDLFDFDRIFTMVK